MRSALAALAVLTLAACDTQQPTPECPGLADCVDPNAAEIVAGVNLTALFAAPTDAERDSVAARLQRTGGTNAPRVTRVVSTDLQPDTDGTRYTRLALRDEQGRAVAYAVARIPVTDPGSDPIAPVVLILPDGSGDASEAAFLTGGNVVGLDRRTVQIALALRGATLTTRGAGPTSAPITTASDLPADPYRADVLDVLALAENVGAVPRANRSRIGVIGVGRGGTVALLAAERAPGRFRTLAPVGAVTDLFAPTVRTDVRRALSGGLASQLPAATALLAPARALASGSISLGEARLQMLELSAVALASRLPTAIVVHADPDGVVPYEHFERLRALGSSTPEARRRFETIPEVSHSAVIEFGTARSLIAEFLLAAL